MNGYLNVKEVALKWKISERQIQLLCKKGRILGAVKFGNSWAIPDTVEKPVRLAKKKLSGNTL